MGRIVGARFTLPDLRLSAQPTALDAEDTKGKTDGEDGGEGNGGEYDGHGIGFAETVRHFERCCGVSVTGEELMERKARSKASFYLDFEIWPIILRPSVGNQDYLVRLKGQKTSS